ncbi:MAG: ABC transporter ATP-binding protein, partial [Clostridia bacterium]|nr:ABC transporter ATP-binding protein [Clostridia bacterium]
MLKKFLKYYRPHTKLFVLDMLCAFLVAVCNMFYPFIAKNIINDYVPNKEMGLIIVWLAVLLGIFVLKAILNYIIQYWGHLVGLRIQADMRNDMFRRLQRLPFSYYDETRTGSIMSRLINDLFDIA